MSQLPKSDANLSNKETISVDSREQSVAPIVDGIRQENNPLPGWWKTVFVMTLFLSVLYAMYFHIGAPGRTLADTHEAASERIMLKQFGSIGELNADAATIVDYSHKANWLRIGQSVFRSNCAACHGRDGEGKVGPNLTDQYYKNIRMVDDIAQVLYNGAGNGAMPAWKDKLKQNELVLVAAYVASLRGTNVDGKGPDGVLIDAWPEPTPAEVATENND